MHPHFQIWYPLTYHLFVNFFRFEVDFLQAQDVYGPNGFHFNPRPAEGAIVRNSYIDGYWMEEERDGADFPFIEGADFELRFVCGEGKYTVRYCLQILTFQVLIFQPYHPLNQFELSLVLKMDNTLHISVSLRQAVTLLGLLK